MIYFYGLSVITHAIFYFIYKWICELYFSSHFLFYLLNILSIIVYGVIYFIDLFLWKKITSSFGYGDLKDLFGFDVDLPAVLVLVKPVIAIVFQFVFLFNGSWGIVVRLSTVSVSKAAFIHTFILFAFDLMLPLRNQVCGDWFFSPKSSTIRIVIRPQRDVSNKKRVRQSKHKVMRPQRDVSVFPKEGTDYQKAMKWYLKAAAQNDDKAQFGIGRLYEYGQGVTRDYQKAMEWYLKAAVQNNAEAQFRIGRLYELGQGVTRNYQKAMEFFLKASKNNDMCSAVLSECPSDVSRSILIDEIKNTFRAWYSSKTEKSIEELNSFLNNLKTMDILEKDKSLIKREINRLKLKKSDVGNTGVRLIVKYDDKQNGLIGMEEKDFEEKFTSLINQYNTAVTDEKLLHGLLNDFFPRLTVLRSSLLLMQKMGIVERIKNSSKLDSKFVLDFMDTIPTDASIDRSASTYAVLVWCKCYGKSVLNKSFEVAIV